MIAIRKGGVGPVRATAAVAVAVSVVLGLTVMMRGYGIQDLPVGRSGGPGAIDVEVHLEAADGLVPGADVRSGQQVVGRVAALDAAPLGAVVRLSLDSDLDIPRNSTVAVEIPSALGGPYVRLVPPADPPSGTLGDGDVITVDHTELGPRVETLLATLGTVVGGSGLDQLATVTRELHTAFEGRSGEVQQLVDDATRLMDRALDHESDFDRVLVAAADVTRHMSDERDTLSRFLTESSGALDMLASQRESISSLLDATTRLAATAHALSAETGDAPVSLVRDAETVVSALAAFNDRMGSTLGSMNAFMDAFGRAVRGDYLLFDGALEIPESLDSVFAGGYFTGEAPPASTGIESPLSDTPPPTGQAPGVTTGGGAP